MTPLDFDLLRRTSCGMQTMIEYGRMLMLAETIQQEIEGLKDRKIKLTREQIMALYDLEAAMDRFIAGTNRQIKMLLEDIETKEGRE